MIVPPFAVRLSQWWRPISADLVILRIAQNLRLEAEAEIEREDEYD
jgi:hypothetical protein